MKKIILILLLIGLFFRHDADAQKDNTSNQVSNEEKKEDSKSSKYGERSAYQITFKDGKTGKLWQSKSDGKWYGSNGVSDKGPFTHDQAVKWLYGYKHPNNTGANAAAGAAVGSALTSGSSEKSPAKKTAINTSNTKKTSVTPSKTKKTSINLTHKKK